MVEYFEKTSGFNLIKGMTYKINAQVPRIDVSGNLFYTLRSIREWRYGVPNNRSQDMLFDQVILVPENDVT